MKHSTTNQYRQGTHTQLPTNQLLTRATLNAALNAIFRNLINMHSHNFNTHSFRNGVDTSAKQAGISNSYRKALDRWRSNSYLKYACTPPQDLSKLSKHPVTSSNPSCYPPPHRLYICCYRPVIPVCMCDILIVVLQYACVIMHIVSYVL